jgi:hypothetical protein
MAQDGPETRPMARTESDEQQDGARRRTSGGPLPPARPPRSAGFVGATAVALALLTAILGVVLIREALVAGGLVAGQSWIADAAAALDGVGRTPVAFVVGLLLLLLGIVLLVGGLRPRRHSLVPLRAHSGAYLESRALAPLVQSRAAGVPGVVGARARGGPRRLRLEVTSASGDVSEAVHEAIGRDLRALAQPPPVQVRSRAAAGSVREGGPR